MAEARCCAGWWCPVSRHLVLPRVLFVGASGWGRLCSGWESRLGASRGGSHFCQSVGRCVVGRDVASRIPLTPYRWRGRTRREERRPHSPETFLCVAAPPLPESRTLSSFPCCPWFLFSRAQNRNIKVPPTGFEGTRKSTCIPPSPARCRERHSGSLFTEVPPEPLLILEAPPWNLTLGLPSCVTSTKIRAGVGKRQE